MRMSEAARRGGTAPRGHRRYRRAAAVFLTMATVVPLGVADATFGLSRADRGSGRRETIRVGPGPRQLVAGFGGVWVTSFRQSTVQRIDPATNEVTDRIPVGKQGFGIVTSGDSVWVSTQKGTVARIDPESRTVTATLSVGTQGGSIVGAEGFVWVNSGRNVVQIDPVTNRATRRLGLGDFVGRDLAYGAGSLWVTSTNDELLRVDLSTGQSRLIEDVDATSVTVAGDLVWASGATGYTRLDPAIESFKVVPQSWHDPSLSIAADQRSVYIPNVGGAEIVVVDQSDARIVRRVHVGDPWGVAVGFGSVWVSRFDDGKVVRFPAPRPDA
jgi:YVTN family beta-propeller protein